MSSNQDDDAPDSGRLRGMASKFSFITTAAIVLLAIAAVTSLLGG